MSPTTNLSEIYPSFKIDNSKGSKITISRVKIPFKATYFSFSFDFYYNPLSNKYIDYILILKYLKLD